MVEWVPAVGLIVLLVIAHRVTRKVEDRAQVDRDRAKAEEWREWQESRKP